MTSLPTPRGRLSAALVHSALADPDLPEPDSADDAAISLWLLHELHYRGFDGVPDDAEWDPRLIGVRQDLERELEQRLHARWPGAPEDADLVGDFFEWVAASDGPSLARFVQTEATREQVDELLRARAVYHLKEADPTAWVVPRLRGGPQAALVELQYDEYGGGQPGRLHAGLFARGLAASGLHDDYGTLVSSAPLEVLEQNNAVSMFGLRRSQRAAALGHLAAFEATSSLPSRRMAQGLERLGYPPEMAAYYLEHIEADAVHEQVALRDICAALVKDEPELEADVWFGAWSCLDLEDRAARAMLDHWGVAA